LAVGEYLGQRCPEAVPIIAGDDDRETEGNPGRTAAIRAAKELGCGLVLPPWTGAEPQNLTDFNDLRQWRTRR
jgi:putative DNA primase/helicase